MASRSDATRASLIFRAKGHDSQAWSELVDLYGPLIAHWCYRCGLDSGQAADVVQDVFVAQLALDLLHQRLARRVD